MNGDACASKTLKIHGGKKNKCFVCCVYLAGVDDGLELQSGQQAAVNARLRDGQSVGDVGRGDTG